MAIKNVTAYLMGSRYEARHDLDKLLQFRKFILRARADYQGVKGKEKALFYQHYNKMAVT